MNYFRIFSVIGKKVLNDLRLRGRLMRIQRDMRRCLSVTVQLFYLRYLLQLRGITTFERGIRTILTDTLCSDGDHWKKR